MEVKIKYCEKCDSISFKNSIWWPKLCNVCCEILKRVEVEVEEVKA